MTNETDLIPVCDRCLQASCWQGYFMCDDADFAGVIYKSRKELESIGVEHPSYWKTYQEFIGEI